MKVLVALTASAVALIAAPVAGATTYNNDAPIVIPAEGDASPFPSSITVSGTAGPITDVNVGFDGVSHAAPGQLSVVLVSPEGNALLLMGCVGAHNPAAGVFVTLDDAAGAQLPDNATMSTGTFRPTSHCASLRNFPAPGPLTSYALSAPQGAATFGSHFNGSSAIGTWKLFVRDFSAGDGGSIPGGWSLDVKPDITPLTPGNPTNPTPTPAPPTKKCKKKKKTGKTSAAAAKKKGCKKKRKK